jgi:hypothetical protein
MGARAFDPFVSRTAAWSRLRRRLIDAADRLPYGALAISAHLWCAAVYDGDFIICSYLAEDFTIAGV